MPRPAPLVILSLILALAAFGCQATTASVSRSTRQLAPSVAPTRAFPLAGSSQLVLVVADNWNVNQARLWRLERTKQGMWRPAGASVAVTLGKNGLGWGRGLHGTALGPGPVKVEGDRRSPAGVFTFSTAFAYEPKDLWHPTKMPMHQITTRTVCVETIDSRTYNRIVDETATMAKDWQHPDRMLRPDGQYRYGLFVNHNAPDTKPGAGSCIFMHLWRRPGAPTVGCTAMHESSMQMLLTWLDPARKPILVQLPKAELTRLAPAWGAPELLRIVKRDERRS